MAQGDGLMTGDPVSDLAASEVSPVHPGCREAIAQTTYGRVLHKSVQ
jgi:hypothetical protein